MRYNGLITDTRYVRGNGHYNRYFSQRQLKGYEGVVKGFKYHQLLNICTRPFNGRYSHIERNPISEIIFSYAVMEKDVLHFPCFR